MLDPLGYGGRPCSGWCCPRARSRRPRWSCSRRPTCGCTATPTVAYQAEIDDPRVDEVRILRPQEIPRYVAEGLFDLGITGRDWIEETSSEVVSIGRARSTPRPPPTRCSIVLAVGRRLAVASRSADLPQGVRVSTEYPRADAALLRRARASTPTSGSPTGPPRPRCPTSSTASSTHRDRPGAAGRRPEDHRHDPARRTPSSSPTRRPPPTRTRPTPCARSTPCSRACSRPGARCWSS